MSDAGQQISQEAGTEQSQETSSQAGGEWDPMMPDSEPSDPGESDTFYEEEPTPSGASSAAAGGPAAGGPAAGDAAAADAAAGDPAAGGPETGSPAAGGPETGSPESATDDMMMPEDMTGAAQNNSEDAMMDPMGSGGGISAEIQAAQDALEAAGIALQTAGTTLESATTDQELAAAEAELAKARLSVIVAGQDLLDIKGVYEGTPQEQVFGEAEEALNEANVSIVVATESIFNTRLQLPDLAPGQSGRSGAPTGSNGTQTPGSGGIPGAPTTGPGISGGMPGNSELDKELNESIAIFENRILDARGDVLGSAPPPTAAENIPGVVVLGGSGNGEADGNFEENADERLEAGLPEVLEQGRMPEGAEIARGESGSAPPIPEDIPDPQGDDIVAQQLREAAISETDPALREKLWEEYRRYKAAL